MKKKVIPILMSAIIGLVIISVAIFFILKPHQPKVSLADKITIDTQQQPLTGPKNSPVSFVAFEDFKCSNCKRFALEILPWIKKHYISKQKANLSIYSISFIPGSMTAAEAAHCLYKQNPDFFFPFAHLLYKNQGPENEDWATTAKLLQISEQIKGADQDQLATCLVNNQFRNFINQNTQQAMKLMGNELRTPSLYINGVLVNPLTKQQVMAVYNAVTKEASH